MIENIIILEDVAAFAKQIIEEGVSFHPDDDFDEYINFKTNEPCYSKIEAKKRNRLMNECFEICDKEGADIYEIMLEVTLKETGLDMVIPLPSSIKED